MRGELAFDIPATSVKKANVTHTRTHGCKFPNTQFILYQKPGFFQAQQADKSTQLLPLIVSAKVGASSLSNLPDPVVMVFNLTDYITVSFQWIFYTTIIDKSNLKHLT